MNTLTHFFMKPVVKVVVFIALVFVTVVYYGDDHLKEFDFFFKKLFTLCCGYLFVSLISNT